MLIFGDIPSSINARNINYGLCVCNAYANGFIRLFCGIFYIHIWGTSCGNFFSNNRMYF